MDKEKRTKRLEISGLSVDLYNKVKEEANKEGLTISAFLRELLKVYFN